MQLPWNRDTTSTGYGMFSLSAKETKSLVYRTSVAKFCLTRWTTSNRGSKFSFPAETPRGWYWLALEFDMHALALHFDDLQIYTQLY